MKQPHAIVADDIRNVGSEYPRRISPAAMSGSSRPQPTVNAPRDDRCSESIAVGSLAFIDEVGSELGFKAVHHDVVESDGSCALREPAEKHAFKFPAKLRL